VEPSEAPSGRVTGPTRRSRTRYERRKLFSLSLSLSLFQFAHSRALKLCINSRKLNFFYDADTGNAESQAHRSDDRGERGFVFAVFRRREFVALREAILEGKKESFSVKISIGVKSIT
jgi:hypothetical protein